jgi:hypothetical protein
MIKKIIAIKNVLIETQVGDDIVIVIDQLNEECGVVFGEEIAEKTSCYEYLEKAVTFLTWWPNQQHKYIKDKRDELPACCFSNKVGDFFRYLLIDTASGSSNRSKRTIPYESTVFGIQLHRFVHSLGNDFVNRPYTTVVSTIGAMLPQHIARTYKDVSGETDKVKTYFSKFFSIVLTAVDVAVNPFSSLFSTFSPVITDGISKISSKLPESYKDYIGSVVAEDTLRMACNVLLVSGGRIVGAYMDGIDEPAPLGPLSALSFFSS